MGVAAAVVASYTRPFTGGADLVTAIPLAGAAVVTAWSIRQSRPTDADGRAGSRRSATRWSRWWPVWTVPILGITAWELYCYVSLPRAQHPTLSALIDSLDSSRVGKTVAFALWLALGWFLVAR